MDRLRLGTVKWFVCWFAIGCGAPPAPDPLPSAAPHPPPANGSQKRAPENDDEIARKLARMFTLEVLGFEIIGHGDANTALIADKLTLELREAAGVYDFITLESGQHQLIDELIVNNCTTARTPCMANIGRTLDVDRLIYGSIDKTSGTPLSIKMLTVKTQVVIEFHSATLPTDAAGIRAKAREAMASLLGAAQ